MGISRPNKRSRSSKRRRSNKPKFEVRFDKKKPKFEVRFDKERFIISGRPPFGRSAQEIVVNQDTLEGDIEDRRHILHYDEVLKPTIERVITNLYAWKNKNKHQVADLVKTGLKDRGIKRFPSPKLGETFDNLVMKRLVTEINSASKNLVPGLASTNKAIEVVRGYIRKYRTEISTQNFAEDCLGNNSKRMDEYKRLAKETFVCDPGRSDITEERNRIHGEILQFVDECQAPVELWMLLKDLDYSVTFDFSPNITREATVKAFEWQKTMAQNEDRCPDKQLDALLSLLEPDQDA